MNYPDSNDLYNGKFTDGDPINAIPASIASAEHMNAVYDELIETIKEGDVAEDANIFSQLALSLSNQRRSKKVFQTAGDANHIVLTSPVGKQAVKVLKEHDEIHFYVASTNTNTISVTVDGLPPIPVSNVVASNQLYQGALATVSYVKGQFWLTKQVNPLTGNEAKDIAKVITDSLDTMDVGEVALNGATLKRDDHSIFWAKVQATSNLVSQATKNADPQQYAGYYGTGDGESTFTLPILGGEFIRGYDNGRGVDANRVFGSFQGDSIRNIKGEIEALYGELISSSASGALAASLSYSTKYTGMGWTNDRYHGGFVFDASRDVPTANENRPRNITYFFKTRV